MQAYVTRQEKLTQSVADLAESVADLSERMEAGFAEADARVDARFDGLKHLIEARHAELVSALMSMGKR